ncbi:hypothetical protein [Kitasatospora sp. NPDC091207]|uniref:hypothetical protein n=1 Tax=Kitasatospora sp. NPDC091207 TaxID=3364083 RepID=UPI00382E44F8
MNRLSRPLTAALLAAAALVGGAGAAQATTVDLSAHGPLAVVDQPVEQQSAASRCDVEYTVAYYSYRTQGYPELESMLHAEKSYALCQAAG